MSPGTSIQFLLGPAGSGKTYRCLAELRAELKRAPSGPPLLLLAPKQATFILERQLLQDPELAGYTRLSILSFERLATFVLEDSAETLPSILSEEGRVMVLRGLLIQHEAELKVFRSAARRHGFARQLGEMLREFREHNLSPTKLTELAGKLAGDSLSDKLHDFAQLSKYYADWLRDHKLHDPEELLTLAAQALRQGRTLLNTSPARTQLWLDGFAEMTPLERDLLLALQPTCAKATLAFCLVSSPAEAPPPWFGVWSCVQTTFSQLKGALSGPEYNCTTTLLPVENQRTRFSASPMLQAIADDWPGHQALRIDASAELPIRVIACRNYEAEAIAAARALREFVQAGNRYRDAGVVVRALSPYADVLRRIFTRYEIPFFLDQRESIAHHPLAELTRRAWRSACFDTPPEELFPALKTGLLGLNHSEADELENFALKQGLHGAQWRNPVLNQNGELIAGLEELRGRLTPLFNLEDALRRAEPTGRETGDLILRLWKQCDVARVLERWSTERPDPRVTAMHKSAWEQMVDWLDNLQLAFGETRLNPREWLQVIESGLAGLSIGVIPPTVDQVMIGAVDRSRNPDLKLVILLGLQEGDFPSPPQSHQLLSEQDRDQLELNGISLGKTVRRSIARENYLGYIAFTRASERLLCLRSQTDGAGEVMNPSRFLLHLRHLLPQLREEAAVDPQSDWKMAVHASELLPHAAQALRSSTRDHPLIPALRSSLASIGTAAEQLLARLGAANNYAIDPKLVERILGRSPTLSLSALEEFAACPFRFFAGKILKLAEREQFEADSRLTGTLQHEILSRYHAAAILQGGWRALTTGEARLQVRTIADEVLAEPEFRAAIHQPADREKSQALIRNLENFIGFTTQSFASYQLNPALSEWSFGLGPDSAHPWRVELLDGRHLNVRGKIDRVDVADEGHASWFVVIDYKSSAQQPKAKRLENGLDIQLPVYLLALRDNQEFHQLFTGSIPEASGFFIAPLSSRESSADSLAEVEANATEFKHGGFFSTGAAALLKAPGDSSSLFKFTYNKDGSISKRNVGPLEADQLGRLLIHVESLVKQSAQTILDGRFRLAPFVDGAEVACDYCQYAAVCRFDPLIDKYRPLIPTTILVKATAET